MADAAKKTGKKGAIKVGQYVWVKDAAIAGSDLFTKGHVLNIDEKGKATVETTNDVKTQELVLPLAECHQPHPGDDVPDHCQLMYLSQPTLLENTRVRYMEDKIYTYVGSILVAVNPFRMIPNLYSTSNMQKVKGKKLWNAECGPHVFAVSEQVRAAAAASPTQPRAHACVPRAVRTDVVRKSGCWLQWGRSQLRGFNRCCYAGAADGGCERRVCSWA